MKPDKKVKTVKFPMVTHRDSDGKITHEYADVPLATYEQWLKKCYDLSGEY